MVTNRAMTKGRGGTRNGGEVAKPSHVCSDRDRLLGTHCISVFTSTGLVQRSLAMLTEMAILHSINPLRGARHSEYYRTSIATARI